MAEFCRETKPVSPRERRCEWCYEAIPAGERHVYMATQDEDRNFVAFRLHSECREAMDQLEPGDCWFPGDQKRGSTDER